MSVIKFTNEPEPSVEFNISAEILKLAIDQIQFTLSSIDVIMNIVEMQNAQLREWQEHLWEQL